MKIAFTDGEMSNLAADYGQLLCACICEYAPKKPFYTNLRTFSLHDYKGKRWDDKQLAIEWKNALEEYDIVVTWNGVKFDIPFLNTRLQRWDEQEVRVARHKDLMYTARYKLKLSNAKLDTVARFFRSPDQKSFLDPERWTMAMGGHKESYDYIIKHCKLDVAVLAWVGEKSKHLVNEIS